MKLSIYSSKFTHFCNFHLVLRYRLCQRLAKNALKHLDQLEERILQTDQLKNASKRLQHRIIIRPYPQNRSPGVSKP